MSTALFAFLSQSRLPVHAERSLSSMRTHALRPPAKRTGETPIGSIGIDSIHDQSHVAKLLLANRGTFFDQFPHEAFVDPLAAPSRTAPRQSQLQRTTRWPRPTSTTAAPRPPLSARAAAPTATRRASSAPLATQPLWPGTAYNRPNAPPAVRTRPFRFRRTNTTSILRLLGDS